jgi:hypothetical protein
MAAVPQVKIDETKLNTQRGGKNSYTVSELKEIARSRGLAVSGNKTVLINRIRSNLGLSNTSTESTTPSTTLAQSTTSISSSVGLLPVVGTRIPTVGQTSLDSITTSIDQMNIYSDGANRPRSPTSVETRRQLDQLPPAMKTNPAQTTLINLKNSLLTELPERIIQEQDRCSQLMQLVRDAKRQKGENSSIYAQASREYQQCLGRANLLKQNYDVILSIDVNDLINVDRNLAMVQLINRPI